MYVPPPALAGVQLCECTVSGCAPQPSSLLNRRWAVTTVESPAEEKARTLERSKLPVAHKLEVMLMVLADTLPGEPVSHG